MSGMCPQVSSPFILSIKTPHFDYRVFKFYCYHAILKQLSTDFWLLLLLLWKLLYVFSSFNVMLLLFSCFSHVQLCNQMDCSTPGFPVPHHLLKFAQVHVHWIGDDIQPSHLCRPLFLLPSIFPGIRVFSNELNVCIRWPKYWIFSLSPSKEYSSFQWFLLGLTGLISLQSKVLSRVFTTTRIQKHWLFGAQPSLWSSYHSHTWKTTGNTIALTIWTFVSKVMSLLFNMLSRFVIAILPRSKRLLISWLQSPSAVILEPKKMKSDSLHVFPVYLPWSDGTRYHNLSFLNVEF